MSAETVTLWRPVGPKKTAADSLKSGELKFELKGARLSGGWVLVRDAVKRPLPKEAPHPGAFRARGGQAESKGGQASPAAEPAVEAKP